MHATDSSLIKYTLYDLMFVYLCRNAAKKEDERLKKLKRKTEIDSYAECYPGWVLFITSCSILRHVEIDILLTEKNIL